MAKVLLVDGDPERLEALRQGLADEYEVALAQSPSFALTMLEWDRPDVIVSRADLPEIDGYEFCTLIRSDPKTRDLRFLLLAGPEGPPAGAASRARVSLVLGGHFTPSDVARNVRRLV